MNDPFQHGWRDRVVPGSIGIHNCDRALLANAEAIRLGTVYGLLCLRKAQFLKSPLQIIPRSEALFLWGACRLGLVSAQKYMAPYVLDFQLLDKVCEPFGRVGCLFHALYLS